MARKQVALSCYRYCQAIPGSVTPRPWPGSMHLTASHANMARAVKHGTWHTTNCARKWRRRSASDIQAPLQLVPFRRVSCSGTYRHSSQMAHNGSGRARPSVAGRRPRSRHRASRSSTSARSLTAQRTRPRRVASHSPAPSLPVRMAQLAPFRTAVRCRLCAATGASGSVCGAASVRSVASHAAAAARGRRFHPRAFTLLSLSAPSEAALDLGPLTAAFARKARAAMALPRRRATTSMSDALMQLF
jgi:hypothetical protein